MFIEPSEILKQIELEPEMVVADFGAGSGGWAIPVAKIVDEGRVYALDILEDPLSALRRKAESEEVYNIETKIVNLEKLEGSKLRPGTVDLVILSNVLFQIDDKKTTLKEAKRILKNNGKILIVDWKKHDKFGPEEKEAVSEEDVKKLTEEVGLKFIEELDASRYHYALIFEKLKT